MKSIYKSLFKAATVLLLGVILFLADYYGFGAVRGLEFNNDPDALHLYMLDVGQGDAILLKTPANQYLLFDGGANNVVLNELGRVLPANQRLLDYVFLTHPHADHVGGLPAVLENYDVGEIYHTGVLHTSSDYLKFLELIKTKEIPNYIVGGAESFNLTGDVWVELLFPLSSFAGQKVDNLNLTSIVARVSYQGQSVLLMGDAEIPVEGEILADRKNSLAGLSAGLIKIGHHGSKTSTGFEWLNATKPSLALIPCGVGNSFNHPHSELMKKLEYRNLTVFRSDLQGLVHCWTKAGEAWQCEGER
jgi:competence protein ComEC